MKKRKYIISGGGTGGHIFPALAIANEIKKQFPEAEVLFVGSKNRMEMEKVPAAGYPIEGLWISGINRTKPLKNIMFPFKLISSLWKARSIIRKFKPDAVIGTGGFASGPILFMAQKKGIPTFIQEQNSYPGITNKLLSKKVNKIYTAYDNLTQFFAEEKIIKTGNPIRRELYDTQIDKATAAKHFGLEANKKTLLVVGGSLGARPINEAIEKILPELKKIGLQLLWQTGKNGFESYKKYDGKHIRSVAFIPEMKFAYALADVIISRAGAGTISELALVEKPAILIPSPYVAEDHQTKNAQALAEKNAAVLIPEKQVNEKLFAQIEKLFKEDDLYEKMSKEIKKLALPDATQNIVRNIMKTLETR